MITMFDGDSEDQQGDSVVMMETNKVQINDQITNEMVFDLVKDELLNQCWKK